MWTKLTKRCERVTDMPGLLGSIVTPAVVAGVISLLVTNRNEKVRAQRDFITKAFEPARDAIKSAVDAAIAYFPETGTARTPKLEVSVSASEREVRRSISGLLTLHESEKTSKFEEVNELFAVFVSELTSGTFQQVNAAADLPTTLRIADAGANLRAALIALRSEVLERQISNDTLSSVKGVWLGLLGSVGFEPKQKRLG